MSSIGLFCHSGKFYPRNGHHHSLSGCPLTTSLGLICDQIILNIIHTNFWENCTHFIKEFENPLLNWVSNFRKGLLQAVHKPLTQQHPDNKAVERPDIGLSTNSRVKKPTWPVRRKEHTSKWRKKYHFKNQKPKVLCWLYWQNSPKHRCMIGSSEGQARGWGNQLKENASFETSPIAMARGKNRQCADLEAWDEVISTRQGEKVASTHGGSIPPDILSHSLDEDCSGRKP